MTATQETIQADRVKTLADFGLDPTKFQEGFTARFIAMDKGGCWYAFDTRPTFQYEEWTVLGGHWFEIGLDLGEDPKSAPEFVRGLAPEESLFAIEAY